MNEALQKVLDKLDTKPAGKNKHGRDQWKAKCPCHEDNRESLSISEGEKVPVVLDCFAGCANADIVAAMGWKMSDLMPPQDNKPADKWEVVPGSNQFTNYEYTDAQGTVFFRSVRKQFTEKNEATGKTRPGKTFFQQRKAAPGEASKDGFVSGMAGVSPVLFRLPDVLKAAQGGKAVFVVEGEKDAENLFSLGFVATTNAMGAGKWKPEYNESLRGASVVILPDNDAPGRSHAETVAAALDGVAASVRVIELPGLTNKQDISDWLKVAGNDAPVLRQLARTAPLWTPPASIGEAGNAADIPPAEGKDTTGRAVYEPWQIVALLRNLPGYVWQVEAPDTNAAHAARIAMFLKNDLCFCSQLGWLRFNGKHWQMDDKENTAAAALVATLSRRVRDEAAYLLTLAATLARTAGREADAGGLLKAAKELLRHVRQVETTSFIEASLGLAADRLRAPWEAFTPKPWVFGFDNGVWDNGVFREHQQADYMLSVSPVAYLPDASRAEWQAVLDRMTGGDADLARTLQQFAGYCISGASHLRLIPWVYGPRGTGKSTFGELLKTMTGKEAAAMEPDDFGDKSRERTGAKIWNKRLAVCGEAGEQRISPETLKQMSGGDTLPVRYLFKEAFDAPPRHVLLMVANDPPIMNAYDDALKSRVKVLPLVHDLSLPQPFKLTGGARIEAVRQLPQSPLAIGFAAWVVDGLAAVHQSQSVYLAPVVKTATEGFWRDTDPLTGFWETIDKNALVVGIAKAELRRLYEDWCDREGIKRKLQPRQWTKACIAHGLEETKKGEASTRCWQTIETQSPQNTDKTDKTDVIPAKSHKSIHSPHGNFVEKPSVLSVLSVNPTPAELIAEARAAFENGGQLVDEYEGRIIFLRVGETAALLFWGDNGDVNAPGGGWERFPVPLEIPPAVLAAMQSHHAERISEDAE